MDKVGLGIIGLGYIGKLHMRHALKLPNVDLVAVSDLSKKAQRGAKEAGVKKIYADYNDLLKDSNVDAVMVALPTHLHFPCVEKAAEAGKHIYLEKPIAQNLEQATKIVNIAKKNSVELMMGYQLRFNKLFRDLKTKIENGTLGEIETAYASFISSGPFFHRAETHTPIPVPDWWFNKELTGGGALIDVGSHLINLLRWLFGDISSIKSNLGYRFNLDFEDNAMCIIKFKSGTRAVITAGWFSQAYNLGVEVFGSVDHAVARHVPGSKIVSMAQMLTTGMSDFHRPHFEVLEHFVNSLLTNTSPSPSGEDGLKDLEAITQAYKNQISLE